MNNPKALDLAVLALLNILLARQGLACSGLAGPKAFQVLKRSNKNGVLL